MVDSAVQLPLFEEALRDYDRAAERMPERPLRFMTTSSEPLERLYSPADFHEAEYLSKLGFPGAWPYTRGVHATGHRGRLWTMRMFAGFGNAEETNARFKYLLANGNAGLSVAGPAIGSEPGGGNPVYVLTHVDVFPAGKDQTIELLKQLAEASRKEAGNLRFDVLQQDGRANHLPLLEAWRDAPAQSAHAMAEHTRAFRAKLVPLQGALYDERLYMKLQ